MLLIGRKIKFLRKNKGITQEQLAEVLSISCQAVSKWENDIASPDISLIPAIANYFGITIDELFGYRLNSLSYKERFIKFMVDNGVLKFGSFKLNSGRISPFFINTGNYRTGAQLAKLGGFYAECIKLNNLKADALFGPAYKGIPLSVATSISLYNNYGIDVSYCFDRKEVKDHGEGGIIVGHQLNDGDELLIIEDTMTSGKALREVLAKLRTVADVVIKNMIISVDRMEKGGISTVSAIQEIHEEFRINIYSIVSINDIIDAIENGVVAGSEYIDAMKVYRSIYGVE